MYKGGVICYEINQLSGITDDWILEHVVPCIVSHGLPWQVCIIIGCAVLFQLYDRTGEDAVQIPMMESIMRVYNNLGGCNVLEQGCDRGETRFYLPSRYSLCKKTQFDFILQLFWWGPSEPSVAQSLSQCFQLIKPSTKKVPSQLLDLPSFGALSLGSMHNPLMSCQGKVIRYRHSVLLLPCKWLF